MPDPHSSLTPYVELVEVLASLPILLREARRGRRLSIRAAAQEIGISFSTVTRIEQGEDCALSNAVVVFLWLDQQYRPTGSGP